MKYNAGDIRKEYIRLDKITGVDTSKVDIRISTRMSRKLGQFSVSGGLFSKKLEIVISSKIMDDEELFWDTVRHEYAHAAVYLQHPLERHVHDAVWKAMCRKVGCRPKATVKLGEEYRTKERPYKYEVVCKKCGSKGKYKTMSKAVKVALGASFGTLVCRRCGGRRFDVYELK